MNCYIWYSKMVFSSVRAGFPNNSSLTFFWAVSDSCIELFSISQNGNKIKINCEPLWVLTECDLSYGTWSIWEFWKLRKVYIMKLFSLFLPPPKKITFNVTSFSAIALMATSYMISDCLDHITSKNKPFETMGPKDLWDRADNRSKVVEKASLG